MPLVSSVELLRISGEQSSHQGRDGNQSGSYEYMDMVLHQGPSIARGGRGDEKSTKAFKEVIIIPGIFEYRFALNASNNNVVKRAWCIDSGFSWHASKENRIEIKCQYFTNVPLLFSIDEDRKVAYSKL